MPARKKTLTAEEKEKTLASLHKDVRERQTGYRMRALKLFPHLCASCGREFEGSRMKELTVHHRDHDHNNNPPDGSNWELLCIYCHDNEHETHQQKAMSSGPQTIGEKAPPVANPFDALDGLLGK